MAIEGGTVANALLQWECLALMPLLFHWPLKSCNTYDLQIVYVAEDQDQQTINLLGPTGCNEDTGHYNHPLYLKQAKDVGRAIEKASHRHNIVGVGYRITIGGRVVDLICSLKGPK